MVIAPDPSRPPPLARGRSEVRVRYAETDRAGVGYHANTFVWFECARTELLRSLGAPYRRLEEEGWLLTVTEASARYLRSVRYDDRLGIDCAIVEASGARLRIEYEVYVDRDLVTTGATVLACLDAATGRPRRLPAQLLEAIALGAGGRAGRRVDAV
jgi:acyl-CoA thioester hydrolase